MNINEENKVNKQKSLTTEDVAVNDSNDHVIKEDNREVNKEVNDVQCNNSLIENDNEDNCIEEKVEENIKDETAGCCNHRCCCCCFRRVRKEKKKKQKMNFGTKISISSIVVLVVFLFIRFGIFYNPNQPYNETTQQSGNKPTFEIIELKEDIEGLSTRDIVEKNIDSVVMLSVYKTKSDNTNGFSQNNTTSQEAKMSCASGIVMSKDGYIITNRHCVVDEATNTPYSKIKITLNNGTVYENVKIIGADASTDLAVLKIDADNLQIPIFGDPSNLQLGDKVVAIGNGGGLGLSVTQGIVSALARDVYQDAGYAIKCLQIDAAINPGNSGGPLFNAAGQVVAINSAKIVAEEYEGLGFAIPIDEAKKIIDELINHGYVRGRVSLGITGYTYKDAYYQGYLINSINSDSSLKNTKAQSGDLITKIDGVAIENYSQLRSVLSKHKIGDKVILTLARSTNRKVESFTVTATLKEGK